jgi:hypothetical protein
VPRLSSSWKQVGWFYALTFLLLGVIPIVNAIAGGGLMDFDAAAQRASAKTGLPWNSNLLYVVRLCVAEPALWLVVFGSAIPSLAAIIVVSFRGRSQIGQLLRRFQPLLQTVSWRRALLAYAVLVPAMTVCLLATYGIRWALGGSTSYSQPTDLWGANIVIALCVAAFLDQGAVLEELGWRGFAQAKLQDGMLSPLSAAVLVGVGWGLWHVPRDVAVGVIERLGILQYLALFLPSFVLGTVVVSIIAAFFMNRTGGSILPAIMVHGLSNDAIGLSGLASMDVALTPYHQATKALPFAVLAAVLCTLYGRQLGRLGSRIGGEVVSGF